VVPIDADGHTWLVGQHRYPLRRHSWEIPVGAVEPGESPETAAARELSEEVGLRAACLRPLLSADFSTGITDEMGFSFLAWNLRAGEAAPDPTEHITVLRLPFADALAMVEAGEIRDLLSVASLQKVRLLALTDALPAELARLIA
jgi:8-oxo-dGTP pyrophosphatase MutT (NUDIX family)